MKKLSVFLAILGTVLLIWFSTGVGFGGWQPPNALDPIVFDIRIPRILNALLVGAALAAAGAGLQALFENPLADQPDWHLWRCRVRRHLCTGIWKPWHWRTSCRLCRCVSSLLSDIIRSSRIRGRYVGFVNHGVYPQCLLFRCGRAYPIFIR